MKTGIPCALSIDRCPGNDSLLKILGVQPSCAAFYAQALYVTQSNIHAASSPPRGSRGLIAPLSASFVRTSLHCCLEACLRHFISALHRHLPQPSFQGCRLIVPKTLDCIQYMTCQRLCQRSFPICPPPYVLLLLVPIVLLSAYKHEQSSSQAVSAGCDEASNAALWLCPTPQTWPGTSFADLYSVVPF